LNDRVALRLDGMFENSDSFRDHVSLEREGVTPAVTLIGGSNTTITLRYEYLKDMRTADRGVTSFQGRPADIGRGTFYGNPDLSDVRAEVNVASGTIEHRASRFTVRNRTSIGNYDRFYQNFVPGAATADGAQVALTTYNNATNRTNLFNQTDVTSVVSTGPVRHTVLLGAEFGRQLTDNFRNTGFFKQRGGIHPGPVLGPRSLRAGHLPAERDRRRQSPHHERGRGIRAGSDRAVAAGAGDRRRAVRSL
jgi:catecholate siderophore receptor